MDYFCPICYTRLQGNTSEMKRRCASRPCRGCNATLSFDAYLNLPEAIEKIGKALVAVQGG